MVVDKVYMKSHKTSWNTLFLVNPSGLFKHTARADGHFSIYTLKILLFKRFNLFLLHVALKSIWHAKWCSIFIKKLYTNLSSFDFLAIYPKFHKGSANTVYLQLEKGLPMMHHDIPSDHLNSKCLNSDHLNSDHLNSDHWLTPPPQMRQLPQQQSSIDPPPRWGDCLNSNHLNSNRLNSNSGPSEVGDTEKTMCNLNDQHVYHHHPVTQNNFLGNSGQKHESCHLIFINT